MAKRKDSQKVVDWESQLKNGGFAVIAQRDGRMLVTKHGCGAVLEKTASGEPRLTVRPGLMMGDGIAQLLDRGFQKFWQSGERTRPAVAADLTAFHLFESELRAAMGITSLYNAALGTVSARYLYDRVEGRENPRVHKPFS